MQQAEIYEIIEEKYGKLIGTIATKISGDRALASYMDNYQDLWMAVFDAVDGFTKQHDYGNGPVEDWIETKPFDKYLKTCLWNKKNHKGRNISIRYKIHRDVMPIKDEILEIPAASELEFAQVSDDFSIFLSSLGLDETAVINCILEIPDKCITARGKVKIKPIQENLGWTRVRAEQSVNSVKKKMNSNLNRSI